MLTDNPRRLGNFERWKRPSDATSSAHHAMMTLTEWFVRNISFSYDFAINHHAELAERPVEDILSDLSRMQYGCMCGGLSKLMARVAWQEGYDAFEFNFGNEHGEESHVVVLAGEPGGDRIIYDPTFGCFCGNAEGAPVSIQTVIDFLRRGLSSQLRWINFGPRERLFLFGHNPARVVPLKSAITKLDDDRLVAMIDLDLFAGMTFGSIWQWGHKQRPEFHCLFDCLRFPVSTSGEAEIVEIAAQLRTLK